MSVVVAVGRDLIAASRISDAAAERGLTTLRVDGPGELPAPEHVVVAFVDWSARDANWGGALRAWRGDGPAVPRLVLYGYHTDLAAHADARRNRLGPMLSRSRLFSSLRDLIGP